jgi:phenylacetate-CoA ligase
MDWVRELALRTRETMEAAVIKRPALFRLGLRVSNEDHLLRQGRKRAELSAMRSSRTVPAYREFLASHGLVRPDVSFEQLPMMSKDSYVRAYATAERCVGGKFLAKGVAIDESSGSTGQPYNWVRGLAERRKMRNEMACMIEWILGPEPHIAINGFSMGAWATGINVGEALEQHSVVKSTGPDLDKILHTIEFFGSEPSYVLCGYPPFLKLVLDTMRQRGFTVEDFVLHGMVGGEGMSEEFRRYLLANGFASCYSGYGASDLEMSIAFETPESVAIRGLLLDDRSLRQELLAGDHRIPMVFQYNPLNCHIEVTEQGDLVATLNFSQTLSPRIRYNLGDEAKLVRRSELLKIVGQHGHDLGVPPGRCMPLPYLMLFGRRDHTVSVMGANIYPEDIEHALYEDDEIVSGYTSFQIRIVDGVGGIVHPRLAIEWVDENVPEVDAEALARRIEGRLRSLNADFQNAWDEYSDALRFEVELHPRGQGPFANRGGRVKNRYISKDES